MTEKQCTTKQCDFYWNLYSVYVQLYRERLTPVERHGTTTLLGAPLIPLLGISHHDILIETWVVMQSDARLVAKIHSEPVTKHKITQYQWLINQSFLL